MPVRVGLTGGIGSGKSMVARIFEVLGIPVYYADEAAKNLYKSDPVLKKQIISHFGEEAYVNDELNRKYISSIVFSSPEKLELLNSLVHPATIKDAEKWLMAQTSPYGIKEAALIFESGSHRDLDYVIGVFAPVPLRIKRVMARDHITEEEVRQRMNNQIEDRIKMKLCDFIVHNDEKQLLIPQVLEIHAKLLSLSPTPSFFN
ncbi:MAG TPA: dephospho-CoA kinase [Chitinophagaceae bacterium]|nr:dephospho-CoA kinase [Chitinophagaceae bacterium]